MIGDDVTAQERAQKDAVDRISAAITRVPSVERLVTLHVARSGHGQLVAAKVSLPLGLSLAEAAQEIAEIRESVHGSVSEVDALYIEPDVYSPASDPAPPTDTFVLKSSD
ncbi:MAG: cation transporter dimerization domain-containing protein [Microbacterium sp.]